MNQKKHQIKSKITTDKPIGQKEENIQNQKWNSNIFRLSNAKLDRKTH